ncbi:MAG: RNA methyltransferase [Ruthenibacterium sp.]
MNVITSRENEIIKYACKIGQNKAFRQSEQRFLAEGLKLCLDLARTFAIDKVFYTSKARATCAAIEALAGEQYEISESVAQKLSETKAPQGLFVLFQMPKNAPALCAGARYLCLDNVQDPSNVGALMRSAAAFGFNGAVLSAGTADVFCGKALRSSMGAVGQIDLFLQADMPQMIGEIRKMGSVVYAAALQNSVPLASVCPAVGQGLAVVIGNEGNGLGDAVIAACDAAVRIPMTNRVESLNAAVAGSVLLWHFAQVQP